MADRCTLIFLALTACTVEHADDLPVRLRVPLASTTGITGELHVLARNVRTRETWGYRIDAFHVHLPDTAFHRVRVLNHECNEESPFEFVYADLGELRAVGDEAHFFSRAFVIDGQPMAVDIESAFMDVAIDSLESIDAQFPSIQSVVISAADLADGSEGAREACGDLANRAR